MTTGSNDIIASPLGARVEMHTNDPSWSVAVPECNRSYPDLANHKTTTIH